MTNITTLIERLRSSAAAFRENSVFDSEGDEVRLTVQARECDEAAAALEAAVEEIERLRELLRDWRNSWLCPVGPFDADRLLDATDTVLGITPILRTKLSAHEILLLVRHAQDAERDHD